MVGVVYVFTSTEPLMFVKHGQWHLVTIIYQEEVLILKYDMMMGTSYHCWKQTLVLSFRREVNKLVLFTFNTKYGRGIRRIFQSVCPL